MGLFGKKEEVTNFDLQNTSNDEQQRKYELLLKERVNEVDQIVGSKGRCETAPFIKGETYKFYLDDNYYRFQRIVDPYKYIYGRGTVEDIEQVLTEEPLIFKKDQYSCSIVPNELIRTDDIDIIGEYLIEAGDIKIQFHDKLTGNEFVVVFDNTPSNIGGLASFFQSIGVKNFHNIVNVPSEAFKITVKAGNGFLPDHTSYVIFRDHNTLYLLRPQNSFSSNSRGKVRIAEIDASEIKYYKQEGSLRYEQSITGEGGGSTSYGGALVGGLLFGVTGALIGSRANEKPVNVSSTTITHDSRIIVLCITRDGLTYQLSFNLQAEDVFNWIIPEKQYDYVISKRRDYYESIKDR